MASNDNHVMIPSADDMSLAEEVTNSPDVIGQFAACEWAELSDDGKVWVAAIVRAAVKITKNGARA